MEVLIHSPVPFNANGDYVKSLRAIRIAERHRKSSSLAWLDLDASGIHICRHTADVRTRQPARLRGFHTPIKALRARVRAEAPRESPVSSEESSHHLPRLLPLNLRNHASTTSHAQGHLTAEIGLLARRDAVAANRL